MWILIRWLRQKPADLDLQCFKKRIKPDSAGQWLQAGNLGQILITFYSSTNFLLIANDKPYPI